MDIDVKGISFNYQKEEILNDISFTVPSGKMASILGPNGTGKTTLLKCIGAILIPCKGASFVGGKKIQAIPQEERSHFIGYVPQHNMGSSFSISVVDTVMMGRFSTRKRTVTEEDKEIVFRTIERMNLNKFAFKDINCLSGGERQTVFIARALAQNPKILLLDEPTSGLDIKGQLFILSLIHDLCVEKGITVIMIHHDLNLAEMYSDMLICLKDKKIYASGTPKEVLTPSNIENIYGIRPRVIEDDLGSYIRLMKNRCNRSGSNRGKGFGNKKPTPATMERNVTHF